MATITVDVLHDITDAGDGQTTLREAIAGAVGGDTILFHGALAGGTLVLTQGELALTESIDIDGDANGDDRADITISGDANGNGVGDNGDSRIFNLTNAASLKIYSLTMTEGFSNAGSGGAIFVANGTTLNLYDSTVSNSIAQGNDGGGISVAGVFNSDDNLLVGNQGSYGGGLHIFGAGATGLLVDTTIHGNTALNSGGGVSLVNGGVLNLINSTVTGNLASVNGGGIEEFGGSLNITNSVVVENVAVATSNDDTSGAIDSATNSFFGTPVTITTNNNSTNGGGTPLLGALQDNGGPVMTRNLQPDSPLIDAGNPAPPVYTSQDPNDNDRNVGASFDIGATEFQMVVTTLDDEVVEGGNTFSDDLLDGNGLSLREAIAHAAVGDSVTFASELAGGTLRLINGELAPANAITIDGDVNGDEKADITISGDANNNGSADVGDSRIFNITAAGTSTLLSLTLTNGYNAGNGGAISLAAGAGLSIGDTTISNSVSGNYGGAIFAQSSMTLRDVLLTGNSAYQGGGLYITGAAVTGTLIQTTIHNNSVTAYGGGVSIFSGADLSLNNSTITGNRADSGGLNTNYGGGLDIFNAGTITVNNTVIAENTSGLALTPDDVQGTIDSASNSFIGVATANPIGAYGGGGAAATNNGGGSPGLGALADNGGTIMTRAVLPGSPLFDAGFNGAVPFGVIEDANGDPRIVDGTVEIGATEFRLTVTTSVDEDVDGSLALDAADGGGLSLREAIFHAATGQTVFFDESLSGQTLVLAQGVGLGELALSRDINIDGDVDGDNRADISISGANTSRIFNITGGTTDVDLKSLTLINGNAVGEGGAIFANNISTLDILDSTISNNAAVGGGGALRTAATDVSLTNVLMSGNSSNNSGGAASFGFSSIATLTNTTIHGNTSNHYGGGIYNSISSTISLYNSTITNNQADANGASGFLGGGIYNDNILNVTNSIIAGNTSGSGGSEVADELAGTGGTMNATNTLFGIDESAILDINTNNQIGPANLGQLLDNGGTTLTRAPLDGSLAIQGGNNGILAPDTQDLDGDGNTAEDLPLDGTRFFRTAFGVTDMGAVEQRVNETIGGTAADNNIVGGLGNDTLTLIRESAGVEVRLNTGTATGASVGNDTISGFENVEGSNFNDLIFGDNFSNVLNGNGGDDDIFALGADDTVNGGAGNDTLNGNLDGDLLNGDAGDDLVLGAQGNDTLNGGDDNDTVSGGSGDDTVSGGSGMDLVFGGGNNDLLFGDGGNDTLSGGGGNDVTNGGNNDDLVLGAGGNDTVNGGSGTDTVSGGSGVDIVNGGDDNDQVFGAGGNDTISGGDGNDTVSGGTENDDISGNAGADNLIGASGVDRLDGGTGDDILTGGSGADTLVFAVGYEFDTVQGFEDNIDTLELDDALWGGGLTAAQVVATFATQISPGIVEFDFTGGDILRVINGAGITTAALVDDIAIV